MKITHHAITDVGKKRKGNEDSLFANAEQGLFVVADGMGGHAAGEVACSSGFRLQPAIRTVIRTMFATRMCVWRGNLGADYNPL